MRAYDRAMRKRKELSGTDFDMWYFESAQKRVKEADEEEGT